MFKGRGQAIWPRPSTKIIPHVQAWTVNTRVKFQADMTTDTEVKAVKRILAKFPLRQLRRQKADSAFDRWRIF